MLIFKIIQNRLLQQFFLIAIISGQDLENLSFGDDISLDIATWNIEWFPKNGQVTVDYISELISTLDIDVIAIQEIDDTTMFNHMLDSMPGYSGYYESSWFAGLGFIYKSDVIAINDIYEIYTTSEFWNAFPRSPMVMDLTFMDENYFIINNHLKCCGDGILNLNDASDEENRRFIAMNYIKEYVDNYLPNQNVFVLGDLNDDISELSSNNIFQNILSDSSNYIFADMEIAQGDPLDWSFPNWPSHLDHILITNELFNGVNVFEVQTIKIDEYMTGGWSEYDQNISDHRPVAIKIFISSLVIYDINADGAIDQFDFVLLLESILNENTSNELMDIDTDSSVDIYDLYLLIDFMHSI